MMKLAYLILCHKNPEQVQKLISALDTEHVDFFVHIDRKAADFSLPNQPNVFVVPESDRVDVRWATKSMIDATIRLISLMLQSHKKYDYIFLISGQDYPIKSNEEIAKFLEKNQGSNFIEIIEHSDPRYVRYTKRNAVYYPRWMFERSVFAKILKKLYIYITGGYSHTFQVFKRKSGAMIQFEFGSQWWCLTYDCLKWIYEYLCTHEDILRFFENALTPDECLFQTVFMLSPYSETVKDKLMYLRWGENQNNPVILCRQDYETLKASEYLLARKFDLQEDGTILDMLMESFENAHR